MIPKIVFRTRSSSRSTVWVSSSHPSYEGDFFSDKIFAIERAVSIRAGLQQCFQVCREAYAGNDNTSLFVYGIKRGVKPTNVIFILKIIDVYMYDRKINATQQTTIEQQL
eukprot:m.158488 g.158488  ORF g.158488 m.158488 type:complete len:110 (+) comp15138_c0_seq2:452-781(+)